MKNCVSIWLFTSIIPGCRVKKHKRNSLFVLNHKLANVLQKFSVFSHIQEEGAAENTGKEKT